MRRERVIGGARASETARVVPNDAIVLAEEGELRVPHPAIEVAAVQENNERAGTGCFVVEGAARDGDATGVERRDRAGACRWCRRSITAAQHERGESQRQAAPVVRKHRPPKCAWLVPPNNASTAKVYVPATDLPKHFAARLPTDLSA